MSLPAMAPFPSVAVQAKLMPEEWKLCLDSWLLLTQRYLLLSSTEFSTKFANDHSLAGFLTSYVATTNSSKNFTLKISQALRKNAFLLIHRVFREVTNVPSALLERQFLSSLCVAYSKNKSLSDTLPAIWQQHKLDEATSMQKSKKSLISLLEQIPAEPSIDDRLAHEMAFARVCSPYARYLMVGSDLLDAIVSAYDRMTVSSLQSHLVAFAYICINRMMNEQESGTSNLLDQLYSLRSTKILKALIETTPLLAKFQNHVSGRETISGRANPLLEEFTSYHGQFKSPIQRKRKVDKGKRKANSEYGHKALSDVHIHKLTLVTQIQDLFPDLGLGFIVKLLDEYNDDSEVVIAHLLDDSLPPYLKQADRSETFDFDAPETHSGVDLASKLSPRHTPPLPPKRRNIYDNDDFDKLAIDASKLHIGRKNENLTADSLLSTERTSHQRAAILSALAAFDSDDDERDDTYDAEDVGGTVDTTFTDEEADVKSDKNDEALFNAYRMTPELFNRDWNTRRGQPRATLKGETGMTDEAIEGWAIMLSRDPKRLGRLERVHEMGGVSHQPTLDASSWRADSGTEGGEDNDMGGNRGRSRYRGGRGGTSGRGRRAGGAVAGPAHEHDTQIARQKKDISKGARANHNRRDQRAKKMARGGFPG